MAANVICDGTAILNVDHQILISSSSSLSEAFAPVVMKFHPGICRISHL